MGDPSVTGKNGLSAEYGTKYFIALKNAAARRDKRVRREKDTMVD